ncbi:MAG: adenylosuccinate lyase [candidate division Zixibacteria bacterium]|nr:adenylosuccinate lyase [candidate division Zixibacteria bacterium]
MGSHVTDSVFFRDQYGTEEMRRVFDDDTLLQRWLDVEAALARAEAAIGLIPAKAAKEIVRKARSAYLEKAVIAHEMETTSHPIVPVIRALQRVCDDDAGQYIHWGATTQDITDTALVLQIGEAYRLVLRDLTALGTALATRAVEHRDTLMPGRTHGQHALPVTFGYKMAIWVAETRRHIERLDQCKPRLLIGQFAGAAGTLASVAEHGPEIRKRMMDDLGLGVTEIPWHTARDGIAEFVSILGMIAATIGKIANEVINLQRTEIAELEEPYVYGKVGSSTMPHKRNPMICEAIVGVTRLARQQVPLALEAMGHEHERDWAQVHIEWALVPETCLLVAGALAQTIRVINGLIVYPERMARNVDMLQGLILSEAAMLKLAAHIGRQDAHDVVYHASMRAYEEGISLKTALMQEPQVRDHLREEDVEALLEPRAYTGLAGQVVDAVVGRERPHQEGA